MTPAQCPGEIYYGHPQSSRTLFLDKLHQASAGYSAVCNGENLRTNIHRYAGRKLLRRTGVYQRLPMIFH